MPPARFEPAIPAGERLQTHALERSATGIGHYRVIYLCKIRVSLTHKTGYGRGIVYLWLFYIKKHVQCQY
jgi:hypothetical protein